MKIYSPDKVCDLRGRTVLYDSNIWIYLEYRHPSEAAITRVYEKIHAEIRHIGVEIVINEIVLSEFFNRQCRLEYKIAEEFWEGIEPIPSFKIYRKSSEFKPILESIRDTCLNVIDDNTFKPVSLGVDEICKIISCAGDGFMDYTDALLAEQCRKDGIVLVSHDADYAGSDIELLSANHKILKLIR